MLSIRNDFIRVDHKLKTEQNLTPQHTKKVNLPKTTTSSVFLGNVPAFAFRQNLVKPTIAFKGFQTASQKADNSYIAALAQQIQTTPQCLKSVAGINELNEALKTMSFEDFKPENVEKGILKANLHAHTVHSDGKLSVKDFLDQAVEYADKMKSPPLYIAMTDHDSIDGVEEALKIIASDPYKFRNVKFVPGIEISAVYTKDNLIPCYIHVPVYCVNPLDEGFSQLMDKIRSEDYNKAAELFTELNKRYGLDTNVEELKAYRKESNQKDGTDKTFLVTLSQYIYKKSKGIVTRKDYADVDSLMINKYSSFPKLEDIFKALKNNPSMMIGIAHPARYEFKSAIPSAEFSPENELEILIDKFHNNGLQYGVKTAIEAKYQYNDAHADSNKDLIKIAERKSKELNFNETGGIDTHSDYLFRCR